MAKIAINGLGRIDRAFLKLAPPNPELEVVAANDLADPDNLAYIPTRNRALPHFLKAEEQVNSRDQAFSRAGIPLLEEPFFLRLEMLSEPGVHD